MSTLERLQQQVGTQISGGALDYAVLAGDFLGFADLMAGVSFGGPVAASGVELHPDEHGEGFSVVGKAPWWWYDEVDVSAHFYLDATDTVAALALRLPPDAGLSIPGFDWLKIDQAYLQLVSAPARLLGDTPLVPPVFYSVGATVTLAGVAVPITMSLDPGGLVEIKGDFAAITFPSLSAIASFLGQDEDINLPPSLDGFTLSLHDVSVVFDPAAKAVYAIGVSVGSSPGAPPWKVLPGIFALDAYSIGVTVANPAVPGQRRVGGFISASLGLGGTTVTVAATHPPAGGWRFEGKADTIPMGALANDLAGRFHVQLPEALAELTLNKLDIAFDTGDHSFHASCACDFKVGSTPVELDVAVDFRKGKTAAPGPGAPQPGPPAPGGPGPGTGPPSYDVVVNGRLEVGTAIFDVGFEDTAGDKKLTADWHDDQHPLDFGDVAKTFGLDLAGVPTELLPQLVEVSFTYDFTKQTLVLTARTEHASTVLVSLPGADGGGRTFAALLGLSVQVDIADLPVVGPTIAKLADVRLDGAQIFVSSGAITAKEVESVNQIVASVDSALPRFPAPVPPATVVPGGAQLTLVIEVNGEKKPPIWFDFSGSGSAATGQSAPGPAALAPGAAPAAGGTAPRKGPPGAWVDVEKSFGPLSLQRIGATYSEGRAWLMLDASMVTSGLSLGLQDLGIGFTLKMPPDPAPRLDGMDLSFSAGPVELSGGLLRVVTDIGVEYDGEALIKVASFALSAIGSYMTMDDGHTSLFVFAVLDIPLGGPPIFFVTGLAAGFGFNRGLRMPSLDDLPKFPLVEAAMASDGSGPFAGAQDNAGQALAVLRDYITPTVGEDWLALGVRFTSFEIVQSFAMIAVKFGTHFELDLLGLSNLSMPPDLGEDVEPIAFAQLALEATFNPDAGIFGIEAKLTSESFVLSKSCHITGGFAFFVWFKDNPAGDPEGYHAGDFVLTIGGYSPFFDPPPFYPVVPRLGLNWTISPQLFIKGGIYFALTAGAVMTGGYLEAMFEAGPLKAWFKAEADFLLGWKPFHYRIHIELSLGFSLNIDLGFINFTITIELGVGLDLWGPTFAGNIHVTLWIISFTIPFGDSNPSPQPIAWDEFKASFLPPAPPGAASSPAPASAALLTPAELSTATGTATSAGPKVLETAVYCSSQFTGGVVKDMRKDKASPSDPDWVVNAERFELVTSSVVPAHAPGAGMPLAVLVSGDGSNAKSTPVETSPGPSIGVGPVAIKSEDFSSLHRVTVVKVDPETDQSDYRYDFSAHSTMSAVTGLAPKAMWDASAAMAPSIGTLNASGGANVPGALTGTTLAARQPRPDVLVPIDVSILLLETQDGPPFSWSPAVAPTTGPFGGQTWDGLAGTPLAIDAPGPAAARSAIVASLKSRGVALDGRVDIAKLARDAAEIFSGRPVLALLGEGVAQ